LFVLKLALLACVCWVPPTGEPFGEPVMVAGMLDTPQRLRFSGAWSLKQEKPI
jgi:hypothetical protein